MKIESEREQDIAQIFSAKDDLALEKELHARALLGLDRMKKAYAYLLAKRQSDAGNPDLWRSMTAQDIVKEIENIIAGRDN